MLGKQILAVAVSCLAGFGLAAELAQANATAGIDPEQIGIAMWAGPDRNGTVCTIKMKHLVDGDCVPLSGCKVLSYSKNPGLHCCLLYRATCPETRPSKDHAQWAGLMHQKIFAPYIDDLTPYATTETPRSIVCPGKDVCNAFFKDRNWAPRNGDDPRDQVNMAPYFVDYRSVPNRKWM